MPRTLLEVAYRGEAQAKPPAIVATAGGVNVLIFYLLTTNMSSERNY
jgi:hypothetical protein